MLESLDLGLPLLDIQMTDGTKWWRSTWTQCTMAWSLACGWCKNRAMAWSLTCPHSLGSLGTRMWPRIPRRRQQLLVTPHVLSLLSFFLFFSNSFFLSHFYVSQDSRDQLPWKQLGLVWEWIACVPQESWRNLLNKWSRVPPIRRSFRSNFHRTTLSLGHQNHLMLVRRPSLSLHCQLRALSRTLWFPFNQLARHHFLLQTNHGLSLVLTCWLMQGTQQNNGTRVVLFLFLCVLISSAGFFVWWFPTSPLPRNVAPEILVTLALIATLASFCRWPKWSSPPHAQNRQIPPLSEAVESLPLLLPLHPLPTYFCPEIQFWWCFHLWGWWRDVGGEALGGRSLSAFLSSGWPHDERQTAHSHQKTLKIAPIWPFHPLQAMMGEKWIGKSICLFVLQMPYCSGSLVRPSSPAHSAGPPSFPNASCPPFAFPFSGPPWRQIRTGPLAQLLPENVVWSLPHTPRQQRWWTAVLRSSDKILALGSPQRRCWDTCCKWQWNPMVQGAVII